MCVNKIAIGTITTEIFCRIQWFVGDCDGTFCVLLVLMIVDFISNIICVILKEKRASKIDLRYICKKILIIMLVGVGNLLDNYVVGRGLNLRTMIILFYIAQEGTTFLRNAANIGIPIPVKLQKILELIQNNTKNNNKL